MVQFGAYSYDAENRMTSGGGSSYLYDADGNRIAKLGASNELHWLGVDSETLAESGTDGTLTAEYIFFGGKRIARIDNPTQQGALPVYYISDHLGSASVLVNADGTSRGETMYFPFGGERWSSVSDSNHYKFTGKERDSETGLDYFAARYYGSNMGRWMSPDWAGAPEPVPYADFSDPQTLNLYGYVTNNPLSHADTDGHCCDDLPQESRDAIDYGTGLIRGVVASLTFGLVGAPSPDDSVASRTGQLSGTAAVIADGDAAFTTGMGGVGVGLAAAPESSGTSLTITGGGALLATGGAYAATGGAWNLAKLINSPIESRRVGEYTKGDKNKIDAENAAKNGGKNACDNCGRDLQKVGNQRGQPTPKNQLQRHHDPPIHKGGGRHSKSKVLCPECHLKEHKQ